LIHFGIDTAKNYINVTRPNWVVVPYFVDQFLHISSIVFIALLISRFSGIPPFAFKSPWLIILTAILVVTYVWYISERMIAYHNPGNFQQVIDKEWSRMVSRALLLGVFLVSILSLSSSKLLSLGFLQFPYRSENHGFRALLTDLLVSIIGVVFIFRVM
jgi:hypothetical protein